MCRKCVKGTPITDKGEEPVEAQRSILKSKTVKEGRTEAREVGESVLDC